MNFIAFLIGSIFIVMLLIVLLIADGFADRRCQDRAERATLHTLCAGKVRAQDLFGDECYCVGGSR